MNVLTIAAALAILASAPAGTPVAGVWQFDFQRSLNNRFILDEPASSACVFKEDSGKLTGTCGSQEAPLMGEVKNGHVTFRVQSEWLETLTGTLSADGSTIRGTWRNRERFGKFTAKKQRGENAPPR